MSRFVRDIPAFPIRIISGDDGDNDDSNSADGGSASSSPLADANQTSDQDQNDERLKHSRFYELWDRFTSAPPPPKESTIKSLDGDEEGRPSHSFDVNSFGEVSRENANKSYEEAREACKSKVQAIVAECKRLNTKYTDPLFNLERPEALAPLGYMDTTYKTLDQTSVKRVGEIFKNPKFIVDGATASDVRQGYIGDCWFLAAVMALSGKEDLLMKVCVDWDEATGVYGFVFLRDGEWISEVIDDKLVTNWRDDMEIELLSRQHGKLLKNMTREEILECVALGVSTKHIKENLKKGSDALRFAKTQQETEETWLPLLEKAYAKAHGDYDSIESGIPGEAIEDLTGGVYTSFEASNILDKDMLWAQIMRVNEDYLIGCGTTLAEGEGTRDDVGIVDRHAYTVLDARTITVRNKDIKTQEVTEKEVRLLRLKNPWGEKEWTGAWSDGSKEWTPDTMIQLGHEFGDDGIFWICYEDFLRHYPNIDITRLFGDEWTIVQQWISLPVPRTISYLDADYLDTCFHFRLTKDTPVVIQLSQPDNRYFRGLEGCYRYELHFKVYRDGLHTYLLRSQQLIFTRSCSAELDLSPGTYTVRVKITPKKFSDFPTRAEAVKKWARDEPEKLLATGKSFDLAHSKGRLREEENRFVLQQKRGERTESKDFLRAERKQEQKIRQRELARRARLEAENDKRREAARQKIIEKRKKVRQLKIDAETEKNRLAAEAEEAKKKKEAEQRKARQHQQQQHKNKHQKQSAGGRASDAYRTPDPEPEPEEEYEDDEDKQPDNGNEEEDIENVADDEIEFEEAVDADFDWDGAIDGPPSDDEDQVTRLASKTASEELFGDGTWDAICVLGMKVFSKDDEMDLKIGKASDLKKKNTRD